MLRHVIGALRLGRRAIERCKDENRIGRRTVRHDDGHKPIAIGGRRQLAVDDGPLVHMPRVDCAHEHYDRQEPLAQILEFCAVQDGNGCLNLAPGAGVVGPVSQIVNAVGAGRL